MISEKVGCRSLIPCRRSTQGTRRGVTQENLSLPCTHEGFVPPPYLSRSYARYGQPYSVLAKWPQSIPRPTQKTRTPSSSKARTSAPNGCRGRRPPPKGRGEEDRRPP